MFELQYIYVNAAECVIEDTDRACSAECIVKTRTVRVVCASQKQKGLQQPLIRVCDE